MRAQYNVAVTGRARRRIDRQLQGPESARQAMVTAPGTLTSKDTRELARDSPTIADEAHKVSWSECWHVRYLRIGLGSLYAHEMGRERLGAGQRPGSASVYLVEWRASMARKPSHDTCSEI